MNTDQVKWWQALNPPIYLISILPAVAIIIMSSNQTVWYEGLFTATLAVVLLQHAINLFNDVSDWNLGADVEKMDSWVRVHNGKPRPVLIHGVLSFLAGGVLGISVLVYSGNLWILWIALPLVWLGYLYNAGDRPLSYTWMGEWVTGICYGGVFGCLWLVADMPLKLAAWCGILAFAALATSLLLSHQPNQIETDKQAGKHSFAVRFGKQATESISLMLFIFAVVLVGVGVFVNYADGLFEYAYSLLAVASAVFLYKAGVNPKRILLSASLVLILVGLYRAIV